jgi:hypothetical protein
MVRFDLFFDENPADATRTQARFDRSSVGRPVRLRRNKRAPTMPITSRVRTDFDTAPSHRQVGTAKLSAPSDKKPDPGLCLVGSKG